MTCPQINNTIIGTSTILYDSTQLPCANVDTCDDINTILSKFNNIICSTVNSVNTLTEEITNITEELMIITEEIEIINNQIFICCPICEFTGSANQLPDPTTTTTTTTTLICCASVTNLGLPGDTILLDGVNLTFLSSQPAGLSIWTSPSILSPACLPPQTLNTVLTGGFDGTVDWDYIINFDTPVNDVKIQVINYSSNYTTFDVQEKITFTTGKNRPDVINCDGCNVIVENNSITSVQDTNGSGTFIISSSSPYTYLKLTPSVLGLNPFGYAVAVFLRICGFTSFPTTPTI
jgi:hypothetical protein